MARVPRRAAASGPAALRAAAAPRVPRCRAARPRPGSPPMAPTARPYPVRPARRHRAPRPPAQAPVRRATARRAMPRPGSCRRFRRRRCPAPDLMPARRPGHRPVPPLARRGDRGRRLLPRTSAAPGPVRLVPPGPGPVAHQAHQAHQADQADQARPAHPVASARAVRDRPAASPHGRPRHGRRAKVPPGPVPRALVRPVRVLLVPAPGRVTTRSARPRPVWGRRRRPGRRVRPLASRLVRASRPAPPVGPAVPAARVPAAAALLAAPARPMARVPAARVRAVPGRAR